jgi:PTH1 family peptidyl-tRNA hydrolase
VKKIKLVILLGNPGKTYENNRHNAGRLLAQNFSFDLQWLPKFKGLYAAAKAPFGGQNDVSRPKSLYSAGSEADYGEKTHFLMPETYMNLSGKSAAAAAVFYKIRCEEILVVHDELELALGQASLKEGGGLNGHNGLRSMKTYLGTADFWRLRIGIGRPGGKKDPDADISAWVLSDFTEEERVILQQVHEACAAALRQVLINGADSLLPAWNKMRIYPAGGE